MNNNHRKKIIVSGSLAYDRIMDFPGHFSDHILPEKIHVLNVCFQVNGMKEKLGGTAGNIAYTLKLMGEEPIISATIGRDYQSYFEWLKRNGISTEGIKIIEDDFTAGAYITTDLSDNQITGFNPGAMKFAAPLDFAALDPAGTIVIVSPGNLDDMKNYPRECKKHGIKYIFDPGQALPMLSGLELLEAIEGCQLLISNDYELDLITGKTGIDMRGLLRLAGAVIVTKGEKGSSVSTRNGELSIPVAAPEKVLDPTGAGDAYRGGLISGLLQDHSLDHCARMGAVCASFCVECYGTQVHKFTPDQFNERFKVCLAC